MRASNEPTTMRIRNPHLAMILSSALFVTAAAAFGPSHAFLRHAQGRDLLRSPPPSSLKYRNDRTADIVVPTNVTDTDAFLTTRTPSKTSTDGKVVIDLRSDRRNRLKKDLVKAAITHFNHIDKPMHAEDIMKKLEGLRPWDRPAFDSRLNARWSFVFTGVPTIGMRLITILSRISVGFPIVDFRDVYLEVIDDQTAVQAVVSAKFFSIPVELNVLTKLEPDYECPKGTMLFETFQGIKLAGMDVPTPKSWSSTRTLEISYLDDDMMIARTAGGEPHLLLRNSHCDSHDEECDVDAELTEFFAEARDMYGDRITRCLVDRDFGKEECGEAGTNPLFNALSLEPRSLFDGGSKQQLGDKH